ncbi:MAG TPA: TetR/AcrR family transcriptional regulator [Myxococcota bacterium]|nr:TetR/AcrR family transcriptional regulator [Myxococcota bacterium]
MANPATSTRERILHQGLALISQSGLAGVTLGVLADQVGMSKSGLFAHFRSKEDVQIELLTHMAGFATAHVVAPSMTATEGLPRLRALVRNWFGWAQRADLPGGCPVASGLFEFDDVEGLVRNKILEMESEWRHMLTRLVQQSVACGHLRRDLDVEQFVWELCGIYLGHHAAHRFLRAADADNRAHAAFQALVERATPPSSRHRVANRAKPEKSRERRKASPDKRKASKKSRHKKLTGERVP